MTIEQELAEIEARATAATPGWRAGRADMQSYTGDGTPMKNMYNDAIEKELLLDNGAPEHQACVYGFNSIADTQFFAHARTDIPRLIEMVRELQASHDILQANHNQIFEAYKLARAKGEIAVDALDHYAAADSWKSFMSNKGVIVEAMETDDTFGCDMARRALAEIEAMK